jgi:hypothetical protein
VYSIWNVSIILSNPYTSDSCTFIIRSPDQCLVFRNKTRSQKLTDKTISSLNTHSHIRLLWHFTMTYYSSDCLIDNRRFLLQCGLICNSSTSSSILWMNELCNKSYLFFQTSTAKCYLVQTMKSLKQLYHRKQCCYSSGTYCEGLYNHGVVFNTNP